MKVILNEEVPGLGLPGAVVDVAPGYARNFLVPRKLAAYASTGSVKELEHHKRRLERKRQRLQAAAMSTAERLNGQTLTFDERSGKEGKLYGSVTTADIAKAIEEKFSIPVDRRKITASGIINTLGEHSVEIHLLGETKATVKVNVIDSQRAAEEAAAAAAKPAAEAAPAEPAAETEA